MIQVSLMHADEFADGGLDFLFARPARPTGGQMRLRSPGVWRGKLAIDRQEQFLIGEMRFFRQHKSPVSSTRFYLSIPSDAVLFTLFSPRRNLLRPWPCSCNLKEQKVGLTMLAGAIAAILLVFALFLSMLSSSPKDDAEWNPDTEA